MSKMDELRAMREARYSRMVGKTPPAPKVSPEEPCGHRNISGRTCTRERDHSAKSHRYTERS